MPDNNEIKFGTDGWRGIIGDNYTFKNLKILSQAVADYLGPGKKVAVGFDTRFMSGEFAQVVASVLAANNIPVLLSTFLRNFLPIFCKVHLSRPLNTSSGMTPFSTSIKETSGYVVFRP